MRLLYRNGVIMNVENRGLNENDINFSMQEKNGQEIQPKIHFDNDSVDALIVQGNARILLDNLDKLSDLSISQDDVMAKIIDSGDPGAVIESIILNPEKCNLLGNKSALGLIDAGYGSYVACFLNRFTNLTIQSDELALRILDHGRADDLADNLSNFTNLSSRLALQLINSGRARAVAWHLENFCTLGDSELVALIEAGEIANVLQHLDKFGESTMTRDDIALRLVESDQTDKLIGSIKLLAPLGESVLVAMMAGNRILTSDLHKIFHYFDNLGDQAAEELIAHGSSIYVLTNIERFSRLSLTHDELIDKMLDRKETYAVVRYLEKFTGSTISQDDLAVRILKMGEQYSILKQIDKFSQLGDQTASALAEMGLSKYVIENPQSFGGLSTSLEEYEKKISKNLDNDMQILGIINDISSDPQALKDILENGTGFGDKAAMALLNGQNYLPETLAGYLDKFTNLTIDKAELAYKLIDNGRAECVAMNIEKFLADSGVTEDELVLRMIKAKQSEAVARNLKKFAKLSISHKELAQQMIEAGQPMDVWENLNRFENPEITRDDLFLAAARIGGEEAKTVGMYLEYVPDDSFDCELAEALSDSGVIEPVIKNIQKFRSITDKVVLAIAKKGSTDWQLNACLEKAISLSNNTALELVSFKWNELVIKYIEKFDMLDIEVLQQLDLTYSQYQRYMDKLHGQVSDDHTKLGNALASTRLFASELPTDILSREAWEPDSIIKEVFADLPDIEPARSLLNSGFTQSQLIRFADRENLSRHDAFLASSDIEKLFSQSNLSTERFFNQIMMQVMMDDSIYEEGNAHHHFNSLANHGIKLIGEIRQSIETVEENVREEANRLFEEFQSDEDIFSSWKNFKSYIQKCDVFQNNFESIKRIAELRKSGKEKLADWYTILAKSNNVSTRAVTEFLTNPHEFFSADSSYTLRETHDAKKPSNYYNIPNLDLTAEELRDALVEGSIDKIASVAPMEVSYEIAPKGKYFADEITKLNSPKKAFLLLGSRRNGIEGLAQDATGLFKSLTDALKKNPEPLTINQFLSGEIHPSEEIMSEIELLLDKAELKKHLLAEKGERYLVSIHPKSSPYGVVAGNDTACCMPFGDGKAVLYMMNPACAQFTIQKEREDGARRTLIQSVMTLNVPVPGHSVTEMHNLLASRKTISEVMPDEGLLTTRKPLLVGDNAEASQNFKGSMDSGELSALLYGDFFARYLDQAGATVSSEEIQIGMAHSDVLKYLPVVPNETLPVAPLSYSDNTGLESYQLVPAFAEAGRCRAEIKIPLTTSNIMQKEKGVQDLTYLDTLSTAYLESKVYSDAKDLLTGLSNMENALIAKDVNNSAKNRPNLSLKYVDQEGVFRSYILAYEGKWRKGNEPCIYISDFASDKDSNSAGFVLRQFCQRYKEAYLDQGKKLPIYAEMRESTSYQLIMKNLPLLERWLNSKIKLEEIETETRENGEKMHVVKIMAE